MDTVDIVSCNSYREHYMRVNEVTPCYSLSHDFCCEISSLKIYTGSHSKYSLNTYGRY